MRESTRTNIEAYDAAVHVYAQRTNELDDNQIEQRMLLLSTLPPQASILDVGCGPGRDASFFTSNGHRVCGIDLSEKMLEMARLRAPEAVFRKMDFANMNLGEEFDGIWMEASLFQIEKDMACVVLEGLRRHLRKDGVVWISVKEGDGERFIFDERDSVRKYRAYYREDEFSNMLEKAGFRILEIIRPQKKQKQQWLCFLCRKSTMPTGA